MKGKGRLVVFLSVGNSSGHRGLTQNSQVMLICTESSQSCGLRNSPRPCGTGGGVPDWAPKQLNGVGREGEREKGEEEGRRREQGRAVSWEMPLWPRPHLEAIVMSRVEPPDSFLPSESMATGWVLDQGLQPDPAFLRRRPRLPSYKLGGSSSGSRRTDSAEPAGIPQGLSTPVVNHWSTARREPAPRP